MAMGFWTLRKPHPAYGGREGNVIYVAFPRHDRDVEQPQDLSNVVRSIHAPVRDAETPSLEELSSSNSLPSSPDQGPWVGGPYATLLNAVDRYQRGAVSYQEANQRVQAALAELQQIHGFQPAQPHWYSGLLRSYMFWATAVSGVIAYAVADHLYPAAIGVLVCMDLGMILDIYRLDRHHARQLVQPRSTPSSSTEAPSVYPQAQSPSRSTLS